ncbi:MAG: hypothetical protein ABJC10_10130 [Acidobacteriota bacterium]
MEANITNEQYFDDDLPLAEPHFDEQATLLSARPVVPLEQIKAEGRSRRRIAFGLAIAGSLVLGAIGGVLLFKQRLEESPAAILGTAVPGAAGLAFDATSPAVVEGAAGAAAGTSSAPSTTTVEKKPSPSISRSRTATVVDVKRKKTLPDEVDERDLYRDGRIDERRLRSRSEREAWREGGGHRHRSADDMLRIREIFEGPSKP